MVCIQKKDGRHFFDEQGRIFWINGPQDWCYFSEQLQWCIDLSFLEVLEWKQCAPSGLVSQRFRSIAEAFAEFEESRITWFEDLFHENQ